MRTAISALALFVFAFAEPSYAQQAGELDTLTQAEAEARKTEVRLKAERTKVTQEIEALKAELARHTRQTQAYERERGRLADRVIEVTSRITQLETELEANRLQTLNLLASLQRLQLAPSAFTLMDPDDAVRTAQAATMIELLSSQLQDRANVTIRLTDDLVRTRDEAALRQSELEANAAELSRRRNETEVLVASKEKLRKSIETEEDKARSNAARLAAEADTLRELLERISAIPDDVTPRLKPGQKPSERPSSGPIRLPPGTTRFAESKGGMVRPVSGTMTLGFGRGEKGQTYSARSGGQVIAPYAGRVEFAGPFKTYGRVVILNMNDGYYLLLTGLGQTYVNTNEIVRRGEPVGLMPGTSGRTPLYIELRRNGRSIDPEPWMGRRG